MSYLAASSYEAIRNDPSKVVDFYNSTRSQFVSDLHLNGLSEDALKAAWCTVIAYGMAPYGAGPPSNDLDDLLASPTLACNGYASLAWQFMDQFGISTDNQVAIGWDDGAVGNHAQMFFSDGKTNLLLDPTIGLVVQGATLTGLISGTHYYLYTSFYSRNDITDFNSKVINAVKNGLYHVSDAIYAVPSLDDWLHHYGDYQGLTVQYGNDVQTIVGSLYNDMLDGGAGNDTLYGGKGNDTLRMIFGSDTGYGGKGNDTFLVNNSADKVIEYASQGTDVVHSTIAYTLPANVENLVLDGSAVYGTGNGVKNMIYGNAAANILSGLDGNDMLYGKAGWDRLSGGNGKDMLDGGLGADKLYGGAGADKFYFRAAADLGVTTSTADVIRDFNPAEGDRISLASIDANTTVPGLQDFKFIDQHDFTTARQVRWITAGGETKILLNTDNDAALEGLIRVAGIHHPDASWFIL